MSRTLKWILGIVAGLVIIAAVAAAGYILWNRAPRAFGYRFNQPNAQVAPGTPGAPGTQPNQPNQPFGFRGYGMNPYGGFGRHMPMMGGRGYFNYGMMPFGFGMFFLGGLLRLLIPLIIVVLVAVLFYQLGKRAGSAPAVVAPPAQPPATPADMPEPRPGRKVAKS